MGSNRQGAPAHDPAQGGEDVAQRIHPVWRDYCSLAVDHADRVTKFISREEPDFYGTMLEEGPAWFLVWLISPR